MSLIVTTQSYRKDTPTEYGLLLDLDPLSGEIRRTLRVDTPVILPGTEGRLKPGLRGISLYEGRLYVTTWNSIEIVDFESFEVVQTMSHPWMSDLHGLYVNNDGIWVTSTLPDALILYNFEGEVIDDFWFPESSVYPERKVVDKSLDWRRIGKGFRGFNMFHCNHVEVRGDDVYATGRGGSTKNGRIYVLDRSAFLDGVADSCEPRLLVDGLFGPHDGVHFDNRIWVTETSNSSVAGVDLDGNVRERFRIGEKKDNRSPGKFIDQVKSTVRKWRGKPASKPMRWTRGLAVDEEALYVGQSTWADSDVSNARIAVFDRAKKEVRNSIAIDIPGYPEARIFQAYLIK